MTTAWVCLAAVFLDTWLGEPQRGHPLGYFLRWVGRIEARIGPGRWRGSLIVAVTVLPVALAAGLVGMLEGVGLLAAALLLYLALGVASVAQQAEAVAAALESGDLPQARRAARWMVGESADEADAGELASLTVASVLRNGNEAGFGPLFWYVLGGAGGAVLFRLLNLLGRDRRDRFLDAGRAAHRLDRILTWLPARLGAVTYGLLGDASGAWRGWRRYRAALHDRGAAPLVAAGAGAIGIAVPGTGGGEGADPGVRHIRRAVQLVQHSLWFWMVVIVAGDLILF